ncbi:hypothetical protein E4T80_11115 [Muribacter muris]|uniref:Mobilization protein n=1 Tax=Muribacter muris TaxID=67855 RepID=A0A4Y9JUL2_9PAST|nr:hypothetical protein [Muribacter muris]MBF0786015.1 hypothetical protein [Muribacter muris]MBF0826781.1 hypothetical protein [Muribacter muris]TFV08146.1 hypothetical protein E4T80_11115 [Muribacter muris]
MTNSKIEKLKAQLQAEIEKEEARKQKIAVKFLKVIEEKINSDTNFKNLLSSHLSDLTEKEKQLFNFIFG